MYTSFKKSAHGGHDLTIWCKLFTLKLYIAKKSCWKQRRDRRYKKWKFANGVIGGKVRRGCKSQKQAHYA